jgi:nitrite reductase/ring-hydroxylating ferredoxin subunit
VGGLALPVLAACGSSAGGAASAGGSGSTGSSSGGGAGGAIPTSEIPKGSGKIFPDQQVVVTQPAAGEYKAFSAVCTHQGCIVSQISGGDIECGCHGSKFSIKDGSVVSPPATQPLAEKKVTVSSGQITVA